VLKKAEEPEAKEGEDVNALKDSYGRVINSAPKEDPKKQQVKMIAGAEDKRRANADNDEKFIKHQSYDNFLRERLSKCGDKHLPH
jgi:hypothetical protein